MSTTFTRSLSSPKPYIGSQRNRYYIYNKPSPLTNDYFFSTIPSSTSFLSNSSKQRTYARNELPTDTFQDRAPKEFISSLTPLDERQVYQGRKTRDFLSSSSSSPLLFPHTQNKTSFTGYEPYSSIKEQNTFLPSPHQYEQKLPGRHSSLSETKNNSCFFSEPSEYPRKRKPYSIGNYYIRQNESLDDKNSLLSAKLLDEDNVFTNDNVDQSRRLPLTSILRPSSNDNISSLSSLNKNNDNKSLANISNTLFDRPLASKLTSSFHDSPNIWQLSNMSSLRNLSSLDSNNWSKTHSYDQRVSDQGNKYVIQLKTDAYEENEFILTPYYSQNQLIVDAKHTEEDSLGGYIRREIHKIFPVPKHVDLHKHSHIYNRHTQELTIEIPYLQTGITENKYESSFISPLREKIPSLTFPHDDFHSTNGATITSTIQPRLDHYNSIENHRTIHPNTVMNDSSFKTNSIVIPSLNDSSIEKIKPFDFDTFHQSAFRPQIIRTSSNENTTDKKLLMSLDLQDYLPEDIKVSIKDQELIVKAERKSETGSRKSRTSFFQSTSLPPLTDVERLQSNYVDGKLIIEAPYLDRHLKKIDLKPEINGDTITKSEKKSVNEDPFQQRTETIIEYVRRRRL